VFATATSATGTTVRTCVAATADVLNSVSATILKAAPASCVQPTTGDATPPPPTTTVDKIGAVVNTPTKVDSALTTLNSDLATAKTTVDSQTGATLGNDFTLIVVALGYPAQNSDGSVKLSVIATFLPTGVAVTTVTDDHKRFYCPIIVKLLANVGGFKVTDLGACTWTAQSSVKRQAASSTYEVSSPATSQSVNNLYGSSSAGHQTISFFLVVVFVIMSLFLF
jgi:hypothetical protein